jgi:hypothetical protein
MALYKENNQRKAGGGGGEGAQTGTKLSQNPLPQVIFQLFGVVFSVFIFFGPRGRRHSLGGELETLVERCEDDELEVIHLETEAANLGLCKGLGN